MGNTSGEGKAGPGRANRLEGRKLYIPGRSPSPVVGDAKAVLTAIPVPIMIFFFNSLT